MKLKYSNLLTDVRQARKWYNQQQAGLGPTIGRYERDEMKPSIDAAAKMADILGVSLYSLVGRTDLKLDKGIINCIQEVTKMKDKQKEHVFAMLDAFITSTKMQGFITK